MHSLVTLAKLTSKNQALENAIASIQNRLLKIYEDPAAPFNRVYEKAFEWCSGPGFIGLHLLEMGICKKLCLADINPQAIESIRNTVKENGLEDRVSFYLSDNFKSVPDHEKFDLIVSNPPNYFALNPEHNLYQQWKDDLRPNDPDWKLHKEFYSTVIPHLLPNAVLLIEEVEPFKEDVYIPARSKQPYDRRGHFPIEEFKKMISEAGLSFHSVEMFHAAPGGVDLYMVASQFLER
jgi:methylase of polypeptide subunit release factors